MQDVLPQCPMERIEIQYFCLKLLWRTETCRIYCLLFSFLLKNICLKNIKTYKNSSFVFCYILEFENVATEASNREHLFPVNFHPTSRNLVKMQKACFL